MKNFKKKIAGKKSEFSQSVRDEDYANLYKTLLLNKEICKWKLILLSN